MNDYSAMEEELIVGEPNIGFKVKRVREIVGIKQGELGRRIGLSQQAVSDLEKSAWIKRPVLEKVAEGLGVNIEAIVRFEEKSPMQFFNCQFSGELSGSMNGAATQNNNVSPELLELMEKFLKEMKK